MISAGSPFHRLLRCLEAGSHEFLDVDAQADFGLDWAAYGTAGFVRPAPPATAAECPDCGGETQPVTHLDPRSPTILCPDCGPVRLSPADLSRSRLDSPALIRVIASAAVAAGDPTEAVPGVWRLGLVRSAVRSKEA